MAGTRANRVKMGSLEVALSLGENRVQDPGWLLIKQHWQTLAPLLWPEGQTGAIMHRAWELSWEKMCRCKEPWRIVSGPIMAMQAYLRELAIEAPSLQVWRFGTLSVQPRVWFREFLVPA